MSSLTANETLQALLSGVTERTEIRDPDGKLLGYFTPMSQEIAEKYERAKKLFDPAEAKRRKELEGERLTTEQVITKLKALGSPQ